MNALRLAALSAAAALAVALAATTTHARSAGPDRQNQQQQQQESTPAAKQEKTFPTKAAWVAVSLDGKPFTGERPSFILDQQFRARGFGGCNTFSATAYPLREQRFAVGPIAFTKKACDKNVMEAERRFLVALRTAVQWDLVGPQLVIKSQAGELRFERTL